MSVLSLDFAVVFIGLSLSTFLYYTSVHVPKGLRLPPGPPRHPIWGNLKDYPSGTLEYLTYVKWAKEYGELVYLNIMGQSILIINSAEMGRELFQKKGAIYSGRPETEMMHKLTIFGKVAIPAMDYGERWTRYRAIAHDVLSLKNLPSYYSIIETNARSFAQRLIAERVNNLTCVRDGVGGLILQLAYGIDVLPENDPYVRIAERYMEPATRAIIPGSYVVDNIPIMKYLPSWLPGLEFPKAVKEMNESFQDMLNIPFDYTKKSFNQGNYSPSLVSNYLEELANNPNPPADGEKAIREVAVAMYVAGIDTLDAQLRSFLLAIALHPGVQKKAQEELDRVVGRDSLPSCADLPNLSYINALCSETLRWHPATPIGLPHKLKQDDVVNGYFIPKGTICIGNSWFLLRSERDYGSNTNEFRPERFLDGSAKLNPDAAFGYGRRLCPGKALAETFFSTIVATVLHVANISVLEDEPLLGIVENHEFAPGAIARPRDFRCRVDARPDAQKLLNQWMSHNH